MMQEDPPIVCSGNDDFGWLQEFLLINCGIRTSPVVAAVEGSRWQALLVARIYLRMRLHLMSKGEALAWVSRRYL